MNRGSDEREQSSAADGQALHTDDRAEIVEALLTQPVSKEEQQQMNNN
ncbi:hypothetical protein ACFFK0_21475 [Paenibacillus chartarius]|uniref:Uncharacterized protein n=1 Tax=Paenibacillus chartarius TaxID=747481 RepID=A0ABV6DQR4_9BACL